MTDTVDALQLASDLEPAGFGIRGEQAKDDSLLVHYLLRILCGLRKEVYVSEDIFFLALTYLLVCVNDSGRFGSFSRTLPALTPSNLKATFSIVLKFLVCNF